MKTLKLDHELAALVQKGTKTSTWRIFDDKNIQVGDTLQFVDKVDPDDVSTWAEFGPAEVTDVIEKPLGEITEADFTGHERFESPEKMLETYRNYYGSDVSIGTNIKIIHFKLLDQGRHG